MRAAILISLVACSGAPVRPPPSAQAPAPQVATLPDAAAAASPPPEPTSSPPPFVPQAPGKVFVTDSDSCGMVFNAVYFPPGSAMPDPRSTAVLDETAAMLLCLRKDGVILYVEVEGHADPGEREPLDLSDLRASVIRSALIKRGVPAETLTPQGYGDTQAYGDPKTASGRALNRRASFLVVRKTP